MKTNNNFQLNTTNFGSIPLYRAVLRQKNFLGKTCPVEAIVSWAEKSDLSRLDLKPSRWFFSDFGHNIIQSLQECSPPLGKYSDEFCLLVEIPTEKVGRQVKAMSSFFVSPKNIWIRYIQSKSQTALFKKIKGAGSLIMYAISKFAQKRKSQTVSLYSAGFSKNFYKKLGFMNISGRRFSLKNPSFEEFQRKLEEKYQIKEIAKI